MEFKRYLSTQSGFSLLEILISLLVISIGMLGLGGLQLFALKSANNAHFRTVASLAATDLADRMRANPVAVENNLYSKTLGIEHCETALTTICEANVECTPSELSIYDLYRVNCGVSVGSVQTGGVQYDLPQALLEIGCAITPCSGGQDHIIRVEWQESDRDDNDASAEESSYELSFIP